MSDPVIFDASAMLAISNNETGADEAFRYLPNVRMNTVNVAEFVSKLMLKGDNLDKIEADLRETGIVVVPFDQSMAFAAGALTPLSKPYGLSLGDRACLAFAQISQLPIVTADKIWLDLNLGLDIRLIR